VSEAFRAIAQEMPSPTCDEFVRVEREMALGGTADEALLELHQRTGVSEYAIFAVTIGVQSRSGGRLAETVQNLADTVRERLMIAAKARAMAGEAKMSAIIMTILPILVGGLMAIINPKQMAPLVDDPRGVRLLVIAIGTLVGGASINGSPLWPVGASVRRTLSIRSQPVWSRGCCTGSGTRSKAGPGSIPNPTSWRWRASSPAAVSSRARCCPSFWA
jgi:hypothetical protein